MNPKDEIQESDLKASIAAKLSPARFPNVSGKMFGCLGALLNQKWTNPRLASPPRWTLEMAAAAGDLTEQEHTFLEALLLRVERGEESSSGTTATNLVIDSISRSSN